MSEHSPPQASSALPPVDEVCRILARVVNRLQATRPAVRGEAS